MRLNLYIAKCGISSRRAADELIASGKVTVNGNAVCKPYYNVCDSDQVIVDQKKLQLKNNTYLAFHKPRGATATKKDKFAEKTILSYLPKNFHNLFPVGRLDKDSSGLLILTNDGDLCFQITHPKFMIEKEYLLKLKGSFDASACGCAKGGVSDDGDFLRVKSIKVVKKNKNQTLCKVIICEGKKRHLRRLFKVLGFTVLELIRVRIGNLGLGNLKPGSYREIDREFVYKKVLFKLKKNKTMVV